MEFNYSSLVTRAISLPNTGIYVKYHLYYIKLTLDRSYHMATHTLGHHHLSATDLHDRKGSLLVQQRNQRIKYGQATQKVKSFSFCQQEGLFTLFTRTIKIDRSYGYYEYTGKPHLCDVLVRK